MNNQNQNKMKRKTAKRVAATMIVALGMTTGMMAADKGDLTIRVDSLRSNDGQVMVALTTEAIPQNMQFVKADMKKSSADGVSFVMADLPDGTYYIQLFHDENGNYNLDLSDGMPAEGFGRYPGEIRVAPKVVIDGSNAEAKVVMVYLNANK